MASGCGPDRSRPGKRQRAMLRIRFDLLSSLLRCKHDGDIELGVAIQPRCHSMLSEKKSLLRIAEAVAIAGTVVALWLAIQSYMHPDADFPVFLAACAGMAVLLLTFLPACILGGEYVRTVRKPSTWRERTEGLNAQEVQAIVRWAPKPYLFGACAGILIAIGTALRYGSITFTDGQAVSPEEVAGLALYFCMFYLLALPVLASAARMPGSYAASDA